MGGGLFRSVHGFHAHIHRVAGREREHHKFYRADDEGAPLGSAVSISAAAPEGLRSHEPVMRLVGGFVTWLIASPIGIMTSDVSGILRRIPASDLFGGRL